jgi:hypothetical protein
VIRDVSLEILRKDEKRSEEAGKDVSLSRLDSSKPGSETPGMAFSGA